MKEEVLFGILPEANLTRARDILDELSTRLIISPQQLPDPKYLITPGTSAYRKTISNTHSGSMEAVFSHWPTNKESKLVQPLQITQDILQPYSWSRDIEDKWAYHFHYDHLLRQLSQSLAFGFPTDQHNQDILKFIRIQRVIDYEKGMYEAAILGYRSALERKIKLQNKPSKMTLEEKRSFQRKLTENKGAMVITLGNNYQMYETLDDGVSFVKKDAEYIQSLGEFFPLRIVNDTQTIAFGFQTPDYFFALGFKKEVSLTYLENMFETHVPINTHYHINATQDLNPRKN